MKTCLKQLIVSLCFMAQINILSASDCDFSNAGFYSEIIVTSNNKIRVDSLNTDNHYFRWETDGGVFINANTIEYATPGTKNLCLVLYDSVLNNTICDTVICHTHTLSFDSCPIRNINFNTTVFQRNDTLRGNFNFSANGYTDYIIDYGDGSPASTLNFHYYDSVGAYNVCLTLSNDSFPDCTETVCRQLVFEQDSSNCNLHADFVYTIDTSNIVQFNFTSTSSVEITSWSYDFGDGSFENTIRNPQHVYMESGTYNVCLTVSDSNNCMDIFCTTIIIGDSSQTLNNTCDTSWLSSQYYTDTIHKLHIKTGYQFPLDDSIRAYLDGIVIGKNAWVRKGFIFFVYDNNTGQNWQTYQIGNTCRGPYNDVTCGRYPSNVFEFITYDNDSVIAKRERKYLIDFLKSIPCNAYVMGYSFYNAGYSQWASDSVNTSDTTLFKAFEDLGVSTIRQQEENKAFAFFLQKCNNSQVPIEIKRNNYTDIIDTTFNFRDAIVNEVTCKNKAINEYIISSLNRTFFEIIPLDSTESIKYYTCDGIFFFECGGSFANAYTDSLCNHYFSMLQFVTNIWTCDNTISCDSTTCLLPGDSDHDLTINNFDVLALGLSYNRTGIMRPNATTQYTLQSCPDWSSTHHYGYNDKFADCNGDGIISASDALVIDQNYIKQAENIFHHRNNGLDSLPSVSLLFDTIPTTIVTGNCVGAQIVADINVGSAVHTATDVYGVAFSVNYPFDNDSCFKVEVDLDPNSWFQTNEPVLLFYKNIPEYKRVDIGIVRTDGVPRSGNGRIGKIKLITEGDIFGIVRRNSGNIQFDFSVINVAAIDNVGNRLGITGSETTASFILLSNKQNKINGLKLYPNPVNDIMYISAKEIIESIRIADIQGRVIQEFSPNKQSADVDFSDMQKGIYVLEMRSSNGVSYEKIIKQ